MSDVARLLEVIRDAAARGDDLATALRVCGVPGGARAAERLAAGVALPTALTGIVPPRVAGLLAGGLPPLATVAALLADAAWRRAQRRRLLADHLAYPLVALALVVALAVVLARIAPAGPWYASLTSSLWALPPALIALGLAVAPWTPRAWRLPGSGWALHLDRAQRWAYAALALRWRLTEADALRLLGVDLAPLATVLGSPGADAHCQLLSEWHLGAARRRLAWTARAAGALVLAAGGGVVLASARMWTATPV